jgi:hypothetical protein
MDAPSLQEERRCIIELEEKEIVKTELKESERVRERE